LINSLSDKQISAYQDSNSRLNIFEGPVRAGKSFIALLRWLKFIKDGPPGPLILCGRTDKTINRNIIKPLQDLIGSAVQYKIGKGEVNLYGRTMYVVGANDDRAEGKIRGSEFAGALIDELCLLPETFVKMLLSRLSIKGAKLFASTNPDSPFHWVKKDWMDRRKELDCAVFSFSIDDNPALDPTYKEQLKKEYQGLWYDRFILGKWVVAEGAVYDFFDKEIHVIDQPPGPASEYIVGIDYGTTNPCVFALIGHNPHLYPNTWLEREYYYDSKKTLRQKSDWDYSNDLQEFLSLVSPTRIYIDPSAASFKVELLRSGVRGIVDADNDVIKGIRYHGMQMSTGAFKVCKCCDNTIKEYSNYCWDTKASNRGVDVPSKQNDHAMDAIRYALTTHFYNKSQSKMTAADARKLENQYYMRRG